MTQTPASPVHDEYSGTGSTSDRRTITAQEEVSLLFDTLNDADARLILQTVAEEPLSAKELSNRCDLPMSTTYRKVNQLSRVGLLEERIEVDFTSKHTSTYTRCHDSVQVSITDDGFELQLTTED